MQKSGKLPIKSEQLASLVFICAVIASAIISFVLREKG